MLALIVTIGGIYVLFKGDVALTKNMVVKGWRARVIGAVLCSYFPIALMIGFALGLYYAIQQQEFPMHYAWMIDLGVLAADVIMAFILGMIWGKPRSEWESQPQFPGGYGQGFPPPGNQFADMNYPPPDKDNPYQPPFTR